MRLLRFLCYCLAFGAAAPAFARNTAFSPSQLAFPKPTLSKEPVVSDAKPVVLDADEVEYFQEQDIVVATGKVEVVQGETVLLADKLIYDRTHDTVTVKGNVSVMDASGNVLFAAEAELRDELRSGTIEQFKARLNDQSLFTAAHAVRVNENVMKLDHAIYSPCRVKCADDLAPGEAPKAPLWQLKAEHVTIDQQEQVVRYNNAWMELFGYPIFYTPYLSHATPDADGKSGLMAPEFQRDRNLGNVYRVPYYYAIAPDKAATFVATQTSQEGLMLRTLYKQKYDTGLLDVDSSITHPRDRDAEGNLIPGHQWRGHLFAAGEFNAGDDTKWGFDVKRTTDDTYMRKYDIDGSTLLESRVYGQTFDFMGDRSALSAEGVAFQGLASTDDSKQIPLALPLVNFSYESDPDANGGRYFVNSNALVLSRDVGANTRRLSNTIGWHLPYITPDGEIFEFKTHLRGDFYDVSDVTLSNGQQFDGTTGRLVPEASMLWRYPFIDQFDNGSVVIEPTVEMAISPNGGNPEKIPNEDSLVPEFTDTNLFSDDRFAGYDRIEHGPRVSYGLRGLVNVGKSYTDWLIGQHYRTEEDRSFPFSNDLNDNLSDYVGKVGFQLLPFYVAYRFRLDKDTLEARRREVDLQYNGQHFTMTSSYLMLKDDPIFASRDELVNTAYVDVTKHWALSGTVRRDLQIDQFTNVGAGILFKNECVNVTGVVNREFTRDRDVKPSTKYLMTLSLKNLN